MKIYFIAIGGSAMHNLALALHENGAKVSGSDDAIFEPALGKLKAAGLLPESIGWDANRITTDIDAVILGMHAKKDNPELLKAQKLGLKIYSYPEYVYEHSKNKLRVVVGGSHGKTTITSMIMHVLLKQGVDFDYLVGAQLTGFKNTVKLSDAGIIIIEGDEYLASALEPKPKFHFYNANIGVISGIAWDHVNVFPTFSNYVEQFKTFINTIIDGKLIYNSTDREVKKLVEEYRGDTETLPYGLPEYEIVNGVTILPKYSAHLRIFGEHNLLNMEAARLVCECLGISSSAFYKSLSTFNGAAKRLERVAEVDKTIIFKDFAHSPSKVQATVKAVKSQFIDRRLVACLELHTFSSLKKTFLTEYCGSMDDADDAIVFIDSNVLATKSSETISEQEIRSFFCNKNIVFFKKIDDLVIFITQLKLVNTNLLIMTSGAFGGLDIGKLASELTVGIKVQE